MKIVDVKLKDLKPYQNNPRHNVKAIKPVKESILKFGFKVPIVIDKDNTIVCGHTRFYASKEIGLETVPCIVADDLNKKQIDAFRLVDNRTSEFAKWDFEKLAEELTDLVDYDLEPFGFDELMAGLKFDTNPFETIEVEDADVFENYSIHIVIKTKEELEEVQNLLEISTKKIPAQEFIEKWGNKQ